MGPAKLAIRIVLGGACLTAGSSAWNAQRSPSTPAVARPKEATLQIVDREGRALESAEVRVAIAGDVSTARSMSFEFPTPPPTNAVDALVERMPVRRSDASGHVQCPWPRERERLVVAKTDTLWGYAWFPKEE